MFKLFRKNNTMTEVDAALLAAAKKDLEERRRKEITNRLYNLRDEVIAKVVKDYEEKYDPIFTKGDSVYFNHHSKFYDGGWHAGVGSYNFMPPINVQLTVESVRVHTEWMRDVLDPGFYSGKLWDWYDGLQIYQQENDDFLKREMEKKILNGKYFRVYFEVKTEEASVSYHLPEGFWGFFGSEQHNAAIRIIKLEEELDKLKTERESLETLAATYVKTAQRPPIKEAAV